MSQPTILIIDDEKNLVRSLFFSLKEEGMTVHAAETGLDGIAAVERYAPDLVLLDLKLPDMSGLDVLDRFAALTDAPTTIMISAHGDTRAAVEAVKRGAQDYITKPFDLDELVLLIRRNFERIRLSQEVHYLRDQNFDEVTHGLIGNSAVMTDLKGHIERVGNSSARTVLLLGPSGGGKTLVAKALHNVKDKDAPFVSVNCASLPETLLEAELFGAEKGAYTGADRKRTGLVELADGGTLFLDEIGELPLNLQAKLLTFLETHTYRAIGGTVQKEADLRVIAATNRDLQEEVRAQRYREDLFYRLNVMPLTVPPLHEREGDALLLTRHFVDHLATKEGCQPIVLDDDVIRAFETYVWPGNVRELRNIIERLTILYPGQKISLRQLPPEITQGRVPMVHLPGPGPEQVLDGETHQLSELSDEVLEKERQCILDALEKAKGRKGVAAEWLGISRHALKRRMQKHKIGDYA